MGVERTMTEATAGGAGAQERLTAADFERGGLQPISHVHRYELAAELCEGARVLDLCCGTGYGARLLGRRARSVHGVDVAPEAVSAAQESLTAAERDRISFEQADALACVRALPQDRFGVVVCFEGIEHVPDPDALIDELARLAEGGARLILSLPNSRGFAEENEFHVTDYGYEEMQAVAERLGGAAIVEQHLAEASVLRPPGAPGDGELRGRLEPLAPDEQAWANHWVLVVNVDPAALGDATARLTLAVRDNHNAYMRQLEEVNAELRRMNTRMARDWLGVHDAGAAVVVRRLEERAERTEAALAEALAEAKKWKQIADNNDWARGELERRLAAPRYRYVDAVRDRVLPVTRPLRRAVRGLKGRGD